MNDMQDEGITGRRMVNRELKLTNDEIQEILDRIHQKQFTQAPQWSDISDCNLIIATLFDEIQMFRDYIHDWT